MRAPASEAAPLQPLAGALVLLLALPVIVDLIVDTLGEVPVFGHRAGRPAVVGLRADRIVLRRQRIAGRPRGDCLTSFDERGDRAGVRRFLRRIVAEAGGEAEALRLDRLGGRPRPKPAGLGADRQRLPPDIERQR